MKNIRHHAAVAAAAFSLAVVAVAHADGTSSAYYDGDDSNPAPLKFAEANLQATIAQELGKKKVATLKNAAGPTELAKLSRIEKVALCYSLVGKSGAEFDVVVEDGGQFTPVEVRWDGDTIALAAGAGRAQLYGKASSREELQKKYGTGAFVDEDAKWDESGLSIVEAALATLTKEELEALAGLPFHRMVKDAGSRAARGTVAALFVAEKNRIEVYDYAFEVDKRRFMGTVEKAAPRSVGTLIHECGHAIARKSLRESRRLAAAAKQEYDDVNAKLVAERKKSEEDRAAYKKSKDAELAKAMKDREAVMKDLSAQLAEKKKAFDVHAAAIVAVERQGAPLERALDAKLSFKKSPTPYGRTSVGESFADCLALFKLDRAALERAAPGVAAWFESPDYTALVKGP